MPSSLAASWLVAASPAVRERISSRLLEGFSEWWQAPGALLLCAAVAAFVLWTYRRDAIELPPSRRILLAMLRLGAFGCLAAAWLDLERTTEYEFVSPSRVAVLVDTSASMTLPAMAATEPAIPAEGADETARADVARDVLEAGGLLAYSGDADRASRVGSPPASPPRFLDPEPRRQPSRSRRAASGSPGPR